MDNSGAFGNYYLLRRFAMAPVTGLDSVIGFVRFSSFVINYVDAERCSYVANSERAVEIIK